MYVCICISEVFGSAIADASNERGGPFWMSC